MQRRYIAAVNLVGLRVRPAADPFTLSSVAPGVYAAVDGPAALPGSIPGPTLAP
ncbi:hypothetical protein GCM10011395_03610 [Sphingomonas psychrolutea]|uniref:Uncharacterized protein n=2 Tax=Sphingomonas psychrolutea TaxID=1259676 RepID=A0ABQ1G3C1_9SPHN|nr:hypothetical protein GCM10011395_03610 [Sphingomonas psychrolutea]